MFGRVYRLRRGKDMLTEEQKRDLENLFNYYSWERKRNSEIKAEWRAKMIAFRSIVSTLGYRILVDKMEESDGVKYQSYRLEKIEM